MLPRLLSLISFACAALLAAAADAPAPVPIDQAAASFSLPEGLQATLFAGEPDIVQPIAMATDARGRLWVVECLSYPDWTRSGEGSDRVTILEDRDGDGRFDSKKIFLNNGRNLSGIAIGFGGVFLCSVPELRFVPDRNGDDIPDGPGEAVLDGWDLGAKHNVFNSLTWGPEGWLYGANGILSNSKIGRPNAPDSEHVAMNCGVWRYHPVKRKVEAVAHGTTNPWGLGFNEVGDLFIANCVIKHLFHVIPGAHYERMFGQDINPYSFELIPSIADHIHWAGGFWKTEGAAHPQNDLVGGGHAHSGAMVYLGTNWPAAYRGGFFTVNIHGHRLNHDRLVPHGSGYIGQHTNDVLRVNDTWFRGVSVIPSHDGNIYVSDWSDAGECHDYDDIHRENGRIYKITYQGKTTPPRDLANLADSELARLQLGDDHWAAGQARRLLQEHAAAGTVNQSVRALLLHLVRQARSTPAKLRLLWTIHSIDGLTPDLMAGLLKDPEPVIRSWAVRLAFDMASSPALLPQLPGLAASESSPVVRLALASALQRLPLENRVGLAEALVARAEDSTDANIPLLLWYGIEPIASNDEATAIRLLAQARLPKVRQFIAQRLALRGALDRVAALLAEKDDPEWSRDVVFGLSAALNGQRGLKAPAQWSAASLKLLAHPSTEVQATAGRLSLVFGDKSAEATLRARVADAKTTGLLRAEALQSLIQARVDGMADLIRAGLGDPSLRLAALRGLSHLEDPALAQLALDRYGELTQPEKNEAIQTLASRPAYAAALLGALESKRIPARDLTPFVARQIQAHSDAALTQRLKALGIVRPIAAEKAARIAQLKSILTSPALAQADKSRGRALFDRTCAACHTLFDTGGTLAPELTGSQRVNLDYLLENIVDPNAVVWDRYKATYFDTRDDRLISGIVAAENESTVTIQTQTGLESLPRTDIVDRRLSSLSMMPEGLLDTLDHQELLDLIAYLQSPTQVDRPSARPN